VELFFKSIKYSIKLTCASSKFLIIPYLLLNFVNNTIPLLNVYILKKVFDEILTEEPKISLILFYISLYIGVIILSQLLSSAYSILENSISEKTAHKYQADFLKKMAQLPLSVTDTSSGRDLIDFARYSGWEVNKFMSNMILAVSNLYAFIVAFTTLVVLNVWVSLLFVILSVPGIIIDAFFDRKSIAFKRKAAPDVRKFSYYRWILTDAQPAKDVRMYDLTDPIKERYDTEKNIYRKANKALDKKKLRASLFAETIKRSGEILFILFVIFQAIDGKVTLGDIALYTGFMATAFSSFQKASEIFSWLFTRYTDNMRPAFEFEKIVCLEEGKGARTLDKFESLTFDNVYFKYPLSEKYVLNGVSFTLNKGDKLSIVGINGAGKSTIIKLMLGLYQIESGQILINGYPMEDYNIKDIRKMFSVLFQNFVQYPLTLRDNVALSDYDRVKNDREIIESLRQSGVYNEICEKLENGIDSYMTRKFDDKGTELSKGQWQKVALSRVYFKNAPIVIFDEPSAALDAEAEDRIFKNFEAISDNKTAIMISHRISASKMSNKIIVLDDGKIVEQGTHDDLVALNGLYAKLYNLQKEKYTIKEDMVI